MRWQNIITALLLATSLIFFIAIPQIDAASFTFSATAKTKFDKLTEASTVSNKEQLQAQYAQLQTSSRTEQNLILQAKTLHTNNQQAEKQLRSKLQLHNQSQIKKQEADIAATKKRLAPIIQLYETHNKQVKVLKSVKPVNKQLLQMMTSTLAISKAAADQAKKEIRAKETKLKELRSTIHQQKKQLRAELAQTGVWAGKIKTAKSIISAANKQYTATRKELLQAVNQQQAADTLNALKTMNRQADSITKQYTQIIDFEKEKSSLLAAVNKKIRE